MDHRVPSFYLFKTGQGNPARDFLGGKKKLEERTYRQPILRPWLCCCCCWWWWCCCFWWWWNMVRDNAGGAWLGMLVLYLLGAPRHVWPLS
uniref:Uncharacterized protein n=1 Tax=Salix viminalis TaxID=40686 RepID=A0A6N2N6Y9_SALVM